MIKLPKYKQTIYILLLTGLILSFIFRIIFLTQSPPGFFSDEVSFGYNAFSIAETGRDEHGVFMPVFFEAFGDYKNPVFVYILVPFVKFLGLSIFSVRFTSAFLGIASILMFIAFLFTVSRDRNLSLVGGLIMSTMSWHFHFSRVGFEAITFVFFIILAMLFFALFIRKKSSLFYLCFGIASILAFFSYSTGRLVVPILVITAIIIWWEKIFCDGILF
ncbi:MAG: phospholipid carrier-dependent glycosyltransferase [Patescibacteria group bacterium]|nr:phospholipid carrier-dependent glycosyltransferase [Patescibacteria group bacterium]